MPKMDRRKVVVGSSAAFILLMGIVNVVLICYTISELNYLNTFFGIFSLPHNAVAAVLTVASTSTIILLIVMSVSWSYNFHSDSIKWNIVTTGFGIVSMITFLCACGSTYMCAANTTFTDYKEVRTAVIHYKRGSITSERMDAIQNEFMCCGAYGYKDWKYNRKFACASAQSPFRCGIPKSCCKPYLFHTHHDVNDTLCGFSRAYYYHGTKYLRKAYFPTLNKTELTPEDLMYTEGCYQKLVRAIYDSSTRLLLFEVVMLLTQGFSICTHCSTVSFLKKTLRVKTKELAVKHKANSHTVEIVQSESINDCRPMAKENTTTTLVDDSCPGATCSWYYDDICSENVEKYAQKNKNAFKSDYEIEHFQPLMSPIPNTCSKNAEDKS